VRELLRAEHVFKTWNPGGRVPVPAVRDVTFSLSAGESVLVVGPSGAGKTTLLCLLGGLLRPDGGSVVFDGHQLSALGEPERAALRLRRIGFVFQRGLLLPHLTAVDNVALVARASGIARRAARERGHELLARVRLSDRAAFLPTALSPGEAQRVALARALALEPALVLADEPTAHLDAETGSGVVAELRRLVETVGASLVVVSHDERLRTVANRVLRMADGRLMPF